jgi:putative membrane protein
VSLTDLPALNATLNAISAVFLSIGYYRIRTGNREGHRQMMTCALVASVLFLTSYLIYHYNVGSVPYPHHDWTRPLYFAILIPHVILAAVNAPFVVVVATRGFKGQYASHRRLARWIWPVWMFVCISGIVIYFMLYHMPAPVVPVVPVVP